MTPDPARYISRTERLFIECVRSILRIEGLLETKRRVSWKESGPEVECES